MEGVNLHATTTSQCLLDLLLQRAKSPCPDQKAVIEHNSIHNEAAQEYSLVHLLSEAQRLVSIIRSCLRGQLLSAKRPLVAIYLERGATYVACVLACLFLRCPFMPVSLKWPGKRITGIIKAAAPSVILWAGSSSMGGGGPPDCGSQPVVAIHFELSQTSTATPSDLLPQEDPCRLASQLYVIWTSGSTGSPQGVCGTELGLLNRVQWMEHNYPWQATDVACFKTSPSFVDSLYEMFGPLLAGVPLVVIGQEVVTDPPSLLEALAVHKISHLVAVPTLLTALAPHFQGRELSLRQLVSSGEPLSQVLLGSLRHGLPGCRILNLYGCTEAAGDSLCFDATDWSTNQVGNKLMSDLVPLGKPIANTAVFIVRQAQGGSFNKQLEVRRHGEQGEIVLAGAGVAAAYDRTSGTAMGGDTFISLAPGFFDFIEDGKAAMFGAGYSPPSMESRAAVRTGDLGVMDREGVTFVGRSGLMSKIWGERVSLTEVEGVLLTHKAIDQAVAKVWSQEGSTRLVAYVKLKAGCSACCPQNLRQHCQKWLSSAALPSLFEFVEELPLLASGKLDRSALPPPQTSAALGLKGDEAGKRAVSSDELGPEGRTLQAFREGLGQPHLEPVEDFFAAGGNSLMAAAVASKLGINATLLAAYPTARKLAGHLCSGALQPTVNRSPMAGSRSVDALEFEEDPPAKKRRLADGGRTGICVPRTDGGGAVLERCGAIRLCPPTSRDPGDAVAYGGLLESLQADTGPPNRPAAMQLKGRWRVAMEACVDASPVLLVQPWQDTATGEAAKPQRYTCFAFASSHGGDVACIDCHSAEKVWATQLVGHADAGMSLTADLQVLAVACSSCLILLAVTDGSILHTVDTEDAIRARPALDPWLGHIWVTSHSRHCYVINSSGGLLCKQDLHAPSSTPAVFDSNRNLAILTTLDGSLIALAVESSLESPSLRLSEAWTHKLRAPVFSAPAVASQAGVCVVATVDGLVTGVSSLGVALWKTDIGVPIYSPLALCHAPMMRFPRSHDSADHEQECVILFGTQEGGLFQLGVYGTHQARKVGRSENGISSGAGLCLSSQNGGDTIFCSCDNEGTLSMHMLDLTPSSTIYSDPEMVLGDGRGHNPHLGPLAQARLPAGVFSSAVMFDGMIFIGCRDDSLYCLAISDQS